MNPEAAAKVTAEAEKRVQPMMQAASSSHRHARRLGPARERSA